VGFNSAFKGLNEKQIGITTIAGSKKKFKRKMDTNGYIVIYNSVNRSTQAQEGVMI